MFTLPLFDDTPSGRPAFITWLLIAACAVVFLWQRSLSPDDETAVVFGLGLVPAVLTGEADLVPDLQLVPGVAALLTSMFLHGGWLHLIGNMLYLWIFGDNVEDAMGHGRFVVFYLACGVVAALAQVWADPGSRTPMIGASGAIAGVLGAYLLLNPRANVGVLLVIVFYVRIILVPAVFVLGLWFLMQLVDGAHTPADEGGVAYAAHVGGFLAGMALIPWFKRPGVPLFAGRRSQAFTMGRAGGGRPGHLPPPME